MGQTLPNSLESALDALAGDALAGDALAGDAALAAVLREQFVDAYLEFKRHEVERFRAWVSDWEFREYAYHL